MPHPAFDVSKSDDSFIGIEMLILCYIPACNMQLCFIVRRLIQIINNFYDGREAFYCHLYQNKYQIFLFIF